MITERLSYKFLMLNEDADDFTNVQNLLFERFKQPLVIKTSFDKAVDFLATKDNPFDAILLDLSLTFRKGKHIVTDLLKLAANSPLIILGPINSEKLSETYINQGVSDYLCKEELNSVLLSKSILYAIKNNKLEQKISLTELNLKDSQKAAKVGTWETNLFDFGSIWSDETYRILGANKKVTISSHNEFLKFIYPNDLQLFKTAFSKSINSKQVNLIHHRIVNNLGKIKFVEQRWKIIRDEELNPIYAVGTCQDVTEKTTAQEKASRLEAYNKDILKKISSHIAILNADGEIIATNEAWNNFSIENGEPLLEKTGDGSNYFKVCEDAWLSGDMSALEVLNGIKRVANGTSVEYLHEYPCHSPQKKQWFVLKAIKINKDKNILITHQDVTTKKIAEIERERIAYDLIQRNKNMEQFSFIVSHNLRAPLANILGLTEISKLESTNTVELLNIINGMSNAAHKMDDVLKDLNKILHTESQKYDTKEEVDFQEITLAISKDIIKSQRIKIQTNFKEVEKIHSLKSYVYSIFYNLINNSIKYQRPNVKPHIQISSKKTEHGILLKFKDNGLGIDVEKNKNRLFGMYNRFHHNTEGKGMGLYMVKTQVAALGGNISVKSIVDKGTVFKIEFKTSD